MSLNINASAHRETGRDWLDDLAAGVDTLVQGTLAIRPDGTVAFVGEDGTTYLPNEIGAITLRSLSPTPETLEGMAAERTAIADLRTAAMAAGYRVS